MPVYLYKGQRYSVNEDDFDKALEQIKLIAGDAPEKKKGPDLSLSNVLKPEIAVADTFVPAAIKSGLASTAASVLSTPQTWMTFLKTGSLDAAADTQTATTEHISKQLFEPKTEKEKAGAEVAERLLNLPPETLGWGAEMAGKYLYGVPAEHISSRMQKRPYNKANEDVLYNPLKTGGELAGELLPWGWGARALRNSAVKGSIAPKDAAISPDFAKGIVADAVAESKVTGEPIDVIVKRKLQTERPTQAAAEQGQLFPETEIDTSNIQSPYNLPESVRIQNEVEINKQGDLFGGQLYTPEELAARQQEALLGEGGTSARNRPDNMPDQRADVDPLSQVPMREAPEAGGIPMEKAEIPADPRQLPTYGGALARAEGRLDIPEQQAGLDIQRPAIELGDGAPTLARSADGLEYNPNDLSTTEQGRLNLNSPDAAIKAPNYETLPEPERQLNFRLNEPRDSLALGTKPAKRSDAMFSGVREAAEVQYKSRDKLISMPIDDFLLLAKATTGDVYKTTAATKLAASGTPFSSLPILLFTTDGATARVTGHEGRHRAKALKALGYTEIPVIFRGDIRWSEQLNPTNFDYKHNWPTTLVGENREALPFPVRREDAPRPHTIETNAAMAPTIAGDVITNPGLREAIDSGSGRQVLQHIANTSENPFFYTLAKLLTKDAGFDFHIVALSEAMLRKVANIAADYGDNVAGLWRQGENRARIAVEWLSENVVLHESIHAKVVRLQRMFESGRLTKGTPEYNAVRNIQNLFEYVKEKSQHLTADDHYGLTDVYEFLTEAFTNKRFQRYLTSIKIDGNSKYAKEAGGLKKLKNAMHALVEYARAAIGMRNTSQDIAALDAIIHDGATLFELIGSDAKLAKEAYSRAHADSLTFDNPSIIGHSKRAPVEPMSKDDYILKNPLGASPSTLADPIKSKVLYEAYKEQWNKDYGVPKPVVGYDNRPTEVFVKEMLNPEGQQRADDIGFVKGTADYASNKNLIVRRVVDNIAQAENAISNVRNDLLRGESIESGLGISSLRYAKHVESVDSLEYLNKKMSSTERASVVEIFNNLIKTSPATILDSKFISSQQGNVKLFLQGLKSLKEKSLKMLNEARKNNGLDPIKDRDDWVLSFVRPGAYHVYTLGPDGKSSWRAGFDSLADAEAVKASLQAKGMKDVIVADAASDARRSALPIEAFYAAQRMAEPGAQSASMRVAIEEATKTLGIKKYALPRDSEAGGMAGDSVITEALGTDKAFDHIFSSIEAYANATANYVGGNEYFTRINETLNHTQLRERYPNAIKHAMDRYNAFRNVDKANMLLAALTGLNKGLINAFVVIANPVFYLANQLQFVFAPARASFANSHVLGGKGNTAYGMVKALERMNLGFTDPETKHIVQQAVKNGSIEPRYAEVLNFTRQEGGFAAGFANVSGQTAAAMTDSYARLMAYFIMYDTAKSAKLADKQAHAFAARESQAVMINYSKWARMHGINALGDAAQLVSPLTTFLTHTMFHIADYVKMGARGNPTPLLMYTSALVAMSGLEGLPGFDEFDSAIAMLSDRLVSKGYERVRTPRELLTAIGANKVVRYGLPSALTGINMTGTFGIGNLIPDNLTSGDASKLFSGPAFATAVADAVITNTQHFLGSDVPEAQRAAALKGVLPSVVKEWVSQAFSGDIANMERTVVNAKGDAEYKRTEKENIKSLMSGRVSIEESQQKYANRRYKANEAAVKELKTYALDIATDAIAKGKPLPTKVVDAIKNYPEVADVLDTESLTKELKRRNIPYRERQLEELMKTKDIATQARKAKALTEIYQGTYGNQ